MGERGGRGEGQSDGWAAARALIAHVPVPAAILDGGGQVRLANAALGEVLHATVGDVEGRRWGELLGDSALPSRCPLASTGDGATGVPSRCACVAVSRGDHWVWLTVEDASIAGGSDGETLRRVTHWRSGDRHAPPPAYIEVTCHIAAGPEFGLLLGPIVTRPPVCALEMPGQTGASHCFEALFARTTPCPGCPARASGPSGSIAVVRGEGRFGTCGIVSATPRDDGTVDVTARLLTDDVMADLLRARVDGMAVRAGLSEREREVFDLVLLGRTAPEIASVLGISARTVKFHQANLMAKLGAESRADLVRLLL